MQCYTVPVLLVCIKWFRCIDPSHVMTHFFIKTLLTFCNSIQSYAYIATFVVVRPFNMHIRLILRVSICTCNVRLHWNMSPCKCEVLMENTPFFRPDWPEEVESSWNVMAHGDALEGKWRGNWRMEWVASTLHTTSEHGVSSITTADAHTSAASSRLNWRPYWFKCSG